MNGQVQRTLKIEDLYAAIIVLIPEHTINRISETAIRGKLDAILSVGKIEGRLSAYTDGRIFGGIMPEQDGLIDDWQRIVDGA